MLDVQDSKLARWIDDHLANRRQAGFALAIEGEQLWRFARFAEQAGHHGRLTVRLAAEWASSSREGKLLTAARRIKVIRPFASYCQQFDPATEIPPRSLFGRASSADATYFHAGSFTRSRHDFR
ncbi:hypothetical protein ACU4GI_32175 [Cupriavidus basilensis]